MLGRDPLSFDDANNAPIRAQTKQQDDIDTPESKEKKTTHKQRQKVNKKTHITESRQWIGRSRDELIAKFGPPSIVLNATLRGRPPSEAYVYDPSEPSRNSCVDAYVIVMKTKEIFDYFCR